MTAEGKLKETKHNLHNLGPIRDSALILKAAPPLWITAKINIKIKITKEVLCVSIYLKNLSYCLLTIIRLHIRIDNKF